MKYYIQTYGCQMNIADSGLIAVHLEHLGLTAAEDPDEADVVVLNTCTVRDHAEHRAMSFIGRLAHQREKRPERIVVVAGCVAQQRGERLQRQFPVVDLVVGAKDIEHFPQLFSRVFDAPGAAPAAPALSSPVDRQRGDASVAAFVTIMRGCSNFCSYCIVPFVRGAETSRPAEEIVEEIRRLAASGTKDVTLLGQNVNSYRDGRTDFARLLALVDGIAGIERIRFMTNHPKDLHEGLIEAVASLPKVCEHVHLPLQSGSDAVLERMNRKYTADVYRRAAGALRARIADVSITTDILVGFPGETDEDFRQTLHMIETVRFDSLFAFKYSPRPGTVSAQLQDSVPREVKEERLAGVLAAGNGISAGKNAILINTVQEILVERTTKGMQEGRTRINKKVFFPASQNLTGRLVPVLITGSRVNALTGRPDTNEYA